MTNRFFLDTNVWVYALSNSGNIREEQAREFIRKMDGLPVVSYQVINETIKVLKQSGTW